MWTTRDLFNSEKLDKDAILAPPQKPQHDRDAMREAIRQRMIAVKQLSERVQNGK